MLVEQKRFQAMRTMTKPFLMASWNERRYWHCSASIGGMEDESASRVYECECVVTEVLCARKLGAGPSENMTKHPRGVTS